MPRSSPPPSRRDDLGVDLDAERDEVEHDRAASPGLRAGLRRTWARMSAGRRRAVVLGVVLTVLGTAMAVWWGVSSTTDKPNWRDVAYDVQDASTVTVRFDVTRPADMAVTCTVEAQETGHGVVGRTRVDVPPGEPSTVRVQATVRTSSPAVYGSVRRCAQA